MSLPDYIASHRIVISRLFALAFFLLIALTQSTHEGNIISSLLFLAGLVLVGIATVGRLWCSLYISGRKDTELTTTGPYSISRNPLYFFSLLGFVGLGLATETLSLAMAFAVVFLLGYRRVIQREEEFLRRRFGQAFVDYCAQTPRCFPKLKELREPEQYVVNPQLFRRTMGDVLWFIWLVGVIELVEALHEFAVITPFLTLP